MGNNSATQSSVRYSINKSVATIEFNRPEAMNCLNAEMAHDLARLSNTICNDPDVSVIIIRGNGRAFMAGGDIQFFHAHLAQLPQELESLFAAVNQFVMNLLTSTKLVISAVHGSVAGIGMSFMLASDLVVAKQETKFTFAYSKIGTNPDGGATFLLPKLLGKHKAMELLLLSEVLSAEEAQRLGLVNWVISEERYDQYVEELAERMATGPLLAYTNIKKLVGQSYQNTLVDHLQAEAEGFLTCARSRDFKIGVEAFLNKKHPEFCGK